ncbi:MAG: hypothetical protein ACTS9Y_00715 [Methylophilus sp.]|uniref:hypothetical protein n=1 Tax=Methylophilus sp. TaxID=29541 RepID=UPI003F9F2AB5
MKLFAFRLVIPALVIALTYCIVKYQGVYLSWFDITPAKNDIHGSVFIVIALVAIPVTVLHIYIEDLLLKHRATN